MGLRLVVVIDHGGGQAIHRVRAVFGALRKRGEEVSRRENRGGCANGDMDGAHLHFEVRVKGEAVDPLSYLFD